MINNHHPRISLCVPLLRIGCGQPFCITRIFICLSPSASGFASPVLPPRVRPLLHYSAPFFRSHVTRQSKQGGISNHLRPRENILPCLLCTMIFVTSMAGCFDPSLYPHDIAYLTTPHTLHSIPQQFVTSPHLTICSRSNPIRSHLICIAFWRVCGRKRQDVSVP